MVALEIICKAIGGGLLVLAFALIAQTLTRNASPGLLAVLGGARRHGGSRPGT
jgi:hypothetical protein